MIKKGTILLFVLVFCFMACDSAIEEVQKQDEADTAMTFARLKEAVPIPQMTDSLERHQLVNRLTRLNDPDKVYYIYLIDHGIIFAQLTLKGKVSSVNSRLTCSQQVITPHGSSAGAVALDSPALDGSYGTNGSAIFFFLADGTMIEWSSAYLLSDRPFRLTQKPLLIGDITDIVK